MQLLEFILENLITIILIILFIYHIPDLFAVYSKWKKRMDKSRQPKVQENFSE